MQTAYSVEELAKRWGLSPASIRRMEQDGKLHRLPDLPGVRYSAAEVYQLESIGLNAQAMSAWERHNLEARIKMLEELVAKYESKMTDMMMILQEVRRHE